MTAFDQAWDSILKIDEGMWEEIYAPLYEVLGGRGKNPLRHANSSSPLDFVPTEMLSPNRHYQGGLPSSFGRGDAYVEMLMESIMEHGMLGRDSDWWVYGSDEKEGLDAKALGKKRYDETAAGKRAIGNVAIPQLHFTPAGWGIGEGNHRTEALRRMGAPYIPAYMVSAGWGARFAGKNPDYRYDPNMIYGEDMMHLMGLDSENYALYPHIADYDSDDDFDFNAFDMRRNESHINATEGYGIPASFGRRRDAVPPSFFFGRELVPGMGRLVPNLPDGLTAQDIPLSELRSIDGYWGKANDPTGDFRRFQDNLDWKVIYDD